MGSTPRSFTLPFVRHELIAKETYAFYFELVDPFHFIPGQYIRMTLPHQNPDERGISRFFSITSSSSAHHLRIITKIIKSSFKKTLVNLSPGCLVTFFGPMGNFILKDEQDSYIFLIGGIGITPLIGILSHLDEIKSKTSVTAIISFSRSEEVIMKDYFEEIMERNPSVRIIFTLTHSESWQGETGRINEELIKKYVSNTLDPYYYIVGPPVMVKAMEEIVVSLGVSDEKIVKENFTGY